MAYESRYTITTEDRRTPCEEILERLYNKNPEAEFCRNNGRGSWYNWIADMRELSVEHPGVLFTVHREGEDSEDVEVGYFLNGRYQGGKAEIRLPEIDDDAWEEL